MKQVLGIIWKTIKSVLTGIIIVISFSLLVMKIMGDTPSLFGYSMYYIATESMEPSLEPGDIILSKQVKDPTTLEVNDVVTYLGEKANFKGKLITHQIIEKNVAEDGSVTYLTKGTNPKSEVDPEINASQIKGVMICEIPLLGKVMKVLNKPIGFLLLIVTPLGVCLIGEIKNLFVVCTSKEESEETESEKTN